MRKLGRIAATPWPDTTVHHGDVHDVEPIPGALVYIDPPYSGTTGYGADLDRVAVLDLAQRWSAAGATVAITEAEPLPLAGWHHVEITSARTSTPRNWSKQQREWLTMNREPASRPAEQFGLFAEHHAATTAS